MTGANRRPLIGWTPGADACCAPTTSIAETATMMRVRAARSRTRLLPVAVPQGIAIANAILLGDARGGQGAAREQDIAGAGRLAAATCASPGLGPGAVRAPRGAAPAAAARSAAAALHSTATRLAYRSGP